MNRIHYEDAIAALHRYYVARLIGAPESESETLLKKVAALRAAVLLPCSQLPLLLFLARSGASRVSFLRRLAPVILG